MNPHVTKYLETVRSSPPPSGDPVVGMRAQFETMNNLFPTSETSFTDREIELEGRALALRCYNQNAAAGAAILFFHGGGFIGGSLNSHDNLCRHLANAADTMVLAIDYRRAPEHPHPAALNDAVDTVHWLLDNHESLNLDPDRLVVVGDSSGGYLAAQVALSEPRVAFQILLYPVLDLGSSSESHRRFATGYGMDAPMIDFCYATYAGAQRHDATISPVSASFPAKVPPALIMIGEQDPLVDEAKAYAERLRAAGSRVTLEIVPDQVHGFLAMPAFFPDAGQYLDLVVEQYKAAIS